MRKYYFYMKYIKIFIFFPFPQQLRINAQIILILRRNQSRAKLLTLKKKVQTYFKLSNRMSNSQNTVTFNGGKKFSPERQFYQKSQLQVSISNDNGLEVMLSVFIVMISNVDTRDGLDTKLISTGVKKIVRNIACIYISHVYVYICVNNKLRC